MKYKFVLTVSFIAVLLLLTTPVFGTAGGPGNPDPKGQLIQLQILGFNDYHGHLEATTPGTIEGEIMASRSPAVKRIVG